MPTDHRESEATGDFYSNERQPNHQFELVITGAIKDVVYHTYFHTEEAVMRALVWLPPGSEWTVNRFTDAKGVES